MSSPSVTAAARVNAAITSKGRIRAERLSVGVVSDLVDLIVSGTVKPGDTLPPEALLATEFAVSRTVIRESIKRLEEKGLIQVGQGRGTIVCPASNWNILDREVLDDMIIHDESLGILDEVVSVRACLEADMTAVAASVRSDVQLEELRGAFDEMRDHVDDVDDPNPFLAADIRFHDVIMNMSEARLGASIARTLVAAALKSERYKVPGNKFFGQTVNEHQAVLDAIDSRNTADAERAMREHILVAWERRRLPVARTTQKT